ncbi:MAG: sulfatase-like hydrolase/transferase, partial [Acidobacteria bacterium]|nr:sulfatase-like hydrolase/transferase [Acidobacteriota bacterium]
MRSRSASLLTVLVLLAAGCSDDTGAPSAGHTSGMRPSILLVTLDTTRADAIGPDAAGMQTPAFTALASRGMRFRQAYATVPETLPSHGSMMTGLYPAGHGIHENGRFLSSTHPVLAERLQQGGYQTAAFVSSFVLAKRFGLARGFEVYDDQLRGGAERSSKETTDQALAYLAGTTTRPRLVWVHYFDPHTPYTPLEPFLGRHAGKPYFGEIEQMDVQLGRLVQAFEAATTRSGGTAAIIIAADHGEGLGEHGEQQHGHLLYQSTMRVPLLIVGPGVTAGVNETPVSTRRIFQTVLDWAGQESSGSLRTAAQEVVLGEAMKPFLSYGWQPQIMAVEARAKAILAGKVETYDLAADPGELRNLGSGTSMPPSMRKALDEYPVPSIETARAPDNLSDDARRGLASLGYVSGGSAPAIRKDAPRPADMTSLFPIVDLASGLFVQERYGEAIPLLKEVLVRDPYNLDAALRLATAHSTLGQDVEAVAAFKRAAAISPRSPDARLYFALHYARGNDWPHAVPILERIVAEQPERLAAIEGLSNVRRRQGRLTEAVQLQKKIHALRTPSDAELLDLGQLAMAAGQTPVAIQAFEKARTSQGASFKHHLELGVLYLAARRLAEAREALDRVPATHPEYPMALFKRAQVSVLLNEPD